MAFPFDDTQTFQFMPLLVTRILDYQRLSRFDRYEKRVRNNRNSFNARLE